MKKFTKSIAMVMAVASMSAAAVPAMAGPNDAAQTTPVQVTSAAAIFDVTVPTALPITIDNQGAITVSDSVKIINNSWGAIKVAGLAVTGQNSWATCDYDSANMAAEKVDTTKLAMIINGDKTTGADAVSFTATNFPKLDGENAGMTDELAIVYGAKVPAQSTAKTGLNVANVIFTIAWDTVA